MVNMSDGCIYKLFFILISVNFLEGDAQSNPVRCSTNTTQCGINSFCDQGLCRCDMGFESINGSNTYCVDLSVPNEACATSDCFYCPRVTSCQKCINGKILTSDGNSCVNNCPDGSSERLVRISDTTLFASVCTSQGDDNSSEIPGVYIGVIVGVSAIVIIILVIMVAYCIYACTIGRKTKRTLEVSDENMNDEVLSHQNKAFLDYDGQLSENIEDGDEDYLALADGDEDKKQFLRKLNKLKKQSSIFLRMLNDMRRRLKELPPDATAARSYKNVMQDVTRLLYLLNKKPQNIQIPPDGMQLLNWSEDILKRYLQSQQQKISNARLSTYGQQAETHF